MSLGLAACGPDEQQQQRSERTPPPDHETQGRAASGQTNAESMPEEAHRTVPTRREASPESGTDLTDLSALLAEEGGGGGAKAYKTFAGGALTVEVPASWQRATGQASEGEGGNWSEFGGEALSSSITAAPDLDAWYALGEEPGVYAAASKALAQRYTDDELVASGPNDASAFCEPGARSDYERGEYSGRVQAWGDCFGDAGGGFVGLSAAPEGRECVVVLHAWMFDEDDFEVAQRILDGFEVDCAAVSSDPPAAADDGQQYAAGQQFAQGPEEESRRSNKDTGLPLDQYGCVPQQVYVPAADGCVAGEGYGPGFDPVVVDPETGEDLGRLSEFEGQ